jgi:hypothetical protein
VSGLLSLELGGKGLRTGTPARGSLTTATPPACDVNLGSDIKVNQNCLNVTDSDLQGRGQAQTRLISRWIRSTPATSSLATTTTAAVIRPAAFPIPPPAGRPGPTRPSRTASSAAPRSAARRTSTAAQRGTDQYFHGMAFNSSGKLVVGAYDRSYATDETTGFSDISVLTSANLKSFSNSQRVTTASMPPATEFAGTFFGDYAQLAVAGITAHPVWSDTRPQDLFLCPGTGTPGNPRKCVTAPE